MKKIGIVVQRYGKEVVGGSESLARDVAERLNSNGFDVRVFSTCAKDYISWANYYKQGSTILNGVIINRYLTKAERNIEEFNQYSQDFFSRQDRTASQEEEWIEKQGPFSPDLVEALVEAEQEIDLFLFFTYLYYPVIEALKVIKKPIFLFPTAHDEAPIYMSIMNNVFSRPQKLFFLTRAEMQFVQTKFKTANDRLILCRTGIDIKQDVDHTLFRRKYNQFFPYLLYAGRIEKGKGLDSVFNAFGELKKKHLIELVLIGKKLMEIPKSEGIKYLGFISEEEKLSAFSEAVFSIQPSSLESLSITTLESFSQGTPVLVNGRSEVLKEHISLSQAGFCYMNEKDFIVQGGKLCKSRALRRKMGGDGLKYVREFFDWQKVTWLIKQEILESVEN
jgi:glycosyltransferase involved in cell wall biosynthesis